MSNKKDISSHSVAKSIIIRNAAALLVIAGVVLILFYQAVRDSMADIYKEKGNIISDYLAHSLLLSTEDIRVPFYEDEHADIAISNIAAQICETYGADYVYLYEADIENETITYRMISRRSDMTGEIPKVNIPKPTKLGEDVLALLKGEEQVIYKVYDNEYGHEYSALRLALDGSGKQYFLGVEVSFKKFEARIIRAFFIIASVILVSFLLISIVVQLIVRKKVTLPAKKIVEAMEGFVKEGERKKVVLEVEGQDEFAIISDAFNTMSGEIDKYIQDINVMNRERERRMAEMHLAAEIQQGFLPKGHIESRYYGISAKMTPAREVGGDLYDYQVLDDNRTLVVVADVSGKGMTAALFMAMTLSLIRQFAYMGEEAEDILYKANNALSGNNPHMLFVTAFIGIYNNKDKTFTYANAGHNIPYIINDELIRLDKAKKVPLGMFEDEEYISETVSLKTGDILFIYTDGVNEAINENKKFYGTDYLESELVKCCKEHSDNPVDYISRSIEAFVGNAEQSDDITMLSLEVRG